MKKRIFAVLLALCLALALVPMSAFAAEGDFVIGGGKLTKYTGPGGDVVIPEGVVSIEAGVFKELLSVTSVTFPSSLRQIGNEAFRGCLSMTSITFANPSNLNRIGQSAFADCIALTSLSLPDSVVDVQGRAFAGCAGLQSVKLSSGLGKISDYTFQGCKALKSVIFPANVTIVEKGAFSNTSLTDVYFSGTEAQWKDVKIDEYFEPILKYATIHYDYPWSEPPAPTTPTNPDPEPSPSPDPKPDPEPSPDPKPSTDPDPDTDLDTAVKVTGVTVSKTGLTMEPGQSVTLTATVSPAAAENKSVTWTSNNPAAVSVDSNGRVTALAAGSAEIVVRTADGGFTAICRVIVKGEDKPAPAEVHFSRMNVYNQGQFTDVPANQWYTDGVKQAFEFGLMKGTSAKKFDPQGSVTVAQAITMAARIHSIYTTGGENFVQGGVWYQVYLDYAFQNGIINYAYYNSDVTKKATRAQFAEIFAGALPEEALSPINDVDDGAIPDVSMSAAYAAAAYKLYRAGILTGSDVMGTFSPDSYITRQEAATIVTRMAESSSRKSFTLG